MSWDRLSALSRFKYSFQWKTYVGGEKVSFSTNEIYVGLGGLNRNSTIGLMHGPKAIGEDPKNSLYFMPWA